MERVKKGENVVMILKGDVESTNRVDMYAFLDEPSDQILKDLMTIPAP